MSITAKAARRGLRYNPVAYQFLFAALRFTQKKLGRGEPASDEATEASHISGEELLDGIREFALQQFGLMTITVFRTWGVHSTDDFGRIVFELIERGEMRKTDRDRLSDFFDVYDFHDAFDRDYRVDTRITLRRRAAGKAATP